LQIAKRSLVGSTGCVTFYNKIVLCDELVEGDEKIREGGEEVAHHSSHALRIHDLGITAGRVMHDFRAEDIIQYARISTINHIIVPSPCDGGTLNLRRNWAGCGSRRFVGTAWHHRRKSSYGEEEDGPKLHLR